MRWRRFQSGVVGLILIAGMLVTLLCAPMLARANAGDSPISLQRFKVVSGDQYFELKNNTDSDIAMADIQLVYYNNYDLAAATTSKIITLSGVLPANGYYLITDGTQQLCYQSAVASASLGFAAGSGQVQLVRWEQNPGRPFGFTTLDAASWYRKSSASAPNPPAGVVLFQNASQNPAEFALRSWSDTAGGMEQRAPAGGTWQVAKAMGNGCSYEVAGSAAAEELADEDFAFLASQLPPVRYVAAVSEGKTGKANRNEGKMAPVINELLPNPASPQTDADDEFVEIYNPNDSAFDLSGFKLAFGSTSPKRYTFPEGTVIQPHEFKVFTSGDTSISLSNTAAQIWLLDPNEKVVHQTEPYSKAKDGQAWALDSTTNTWVWTLQPTPGEMNALTGVAAGTGTATTAKAVLGISTTSNSGAGQDVTSTAAGTLADRTPVHPAVLAVVGIGAVAYALYEYRQDIANRLYQFRQYRERRRALRPKLSRR